MADALIKDIEDYLRLNAIGNMSDGLTLNYIQMLIGNYKKQPKKATQEEPDARTAVATYYGGVNPND